MSRIYCDRQLCVNCETCDECPVTLQDEETIEEQAIKNTEVIKNILDFKE
jgi:hypothetical protein